MSFYLQSYPTRRMARRWSFTPREYFETGVEQARSLEVNIREEDEAYVLSALVPGLNAEDLNIQVLEDVVRIEGEYKSDDNQYLMHELPQGHFQRTLRLPVAVDAELVEANIVDGVLDLRLPKAESARPKKIKVVAR